MLGGVNLINIKERRMSLGLTQFQLANCLNVTQGLVSEWESGNVSPRIDKLPEIAKVLKCEIADLFD